MHPNWPEGSPCHGPGEVEQVYGSIFKCVAGLAGGERVCGALFELAPNGFARVVKVVSSEEVRGYERQAELEDPRGATIADVEDVWGLEDAGSAVPGTRGTFGVECRELADPNEPEQAMLFGFGGIPLAAYVAVAGKQPEAGDRLRVYGRFGGPVRGVDYLIPKVEGDPPDKIDSWTNVYFKTEVELHQEWAADVERTRDKREVEFEERAAEMDAAYEALPAIFRRRVDGYRERGGREWRVDYEGYEVFCLAEAAKIAERVKPGFDELRSGGLDGLLEAAKGFWDDAADDELRAAAERDPIILSAQIAVGRFRSLPREEQAAAISDGHTGNTFGAACQYAALLSAYDAGHEAAADYIVGIHGALAPLVGSRAYSDRAAQESGADG